MKFNLFKKWKEKKQVEQADEKDKALKEKLSKYKYVHVMTSGLHSITILRFINKYFSKDEHCFIFPYYPDKIKEQVDGLENVFPVSLSYLPLETCDKIIFHNLLSQVMINFLYRNPKYLKKSYWFIWGGDLYFAPRTKEHVFVKSNMQGVLTSFDYDEYEKQFGKKKCWDVTYPNNMEESMADETPRKGKEINIMINNCADETTLEMMNILSRFRKQNIRIYTVLSYVANNQQDCRLKIMKKGYELFGEKFHPIIDFMDFKEYAKFLSKIDIYVSNQDRAQGNGNASFICSLGGKVFTKPDSGVYKKYNSLGIKYFDTNTIPHLSFRDFVSYDNSVKKQTMKLLQERVKDSTKIQQWKNFFEYKGV